MARQESGVNDAKDHDCRFTVEGASRPASRIAERISCGISA
jgi:hypothetical protein